MVYSISQFHKNAHQRRKEEDHLNTEFSPNPHVHSYIYTYMFMWVADMVSYLFLHKVSEYVVLIKSEVILIQMMV